jgi:serine/threonine protein kinase/lipoprotein NlpI
MRDPNSGDRTNTHFALKPGTMVAHYRLVEKVGAGGMGEVHLADDTKLQRQVALKFLPATLAYDQEAKTRFTREAQAAAALNHPNIIHVYEVGQFHGRPYFAMEYVSGDPLHRFAHDDPLSVEKVVEMMIQLCEGLAEAHSHGVVHRDIKADNIVVDKKGRPRILDFGLATVTGDVKLTKTGSTLGTVAYMSPEQVSGKQVDQRSDLFSLGVVLYELLTGRTPFKRDSEAATLQAIVNDEPQPLTRYRSDIPEPLCKVVDKLLSKETDFRYQTADGVLPDLRALKAGSSGRTTSVVLPRKRSPLPLIGLIGAVAALVVAVVFWQSWETNAPLDTVPMIAVLPFENLGAPDDEYFADGMTDEVTSRLNTIKGLGVISRTSAIQYKSSDKNLTEIGRELNVGYILAGTVRWSKVGDQVSEDRQMWADTYDRELMKVFQVQADIARQIVGQLGITLVETDHTELASQPTDNPEAYAHYLKGVSVTREPDLWRLENNAAIAQFDSALALDPDFALAYAYKSIAHSWAAFGFLWWQKDTTDHRAMSLASAQKALELQPQLSMGYLAMGTYHNLVERDYDRALEEFSKARSEIHSDAQLIASIALVEWRQGKFGDAQANYRRAVELDPLTAENQYSLAICLSFTNEFDEALEIMDRAIALEPDLAQYYSRKIGLLIDGYGDLEGAKAVLEEAAKHVDVLDVLAEEFLQYGLTEVSTDSLLSSFSGPFRDSVPPGMYYGAVAGAYRAAGQTELMIEYCDSTRIAIEATLPYVTDEHGIYEGLGLAYACLGEAEKAIEAGLKAKEIMSVDDCHW